jgi:hypothetical protein
MQIKRKKTTNYINNKDLYTALIARHTELKKCCKNDIEKPQVSQYIGQSILLICNNLAKKPNFSGYTYKQEMISDGVVDCISAVDNFNPAKTNNPFAYFTQIAWNAFVRRIHKEKKQSYIKHKNFENSFLLSGGYTESGTQLKSNECSDEIVRNFENKLTKNKKTNKMKGLEIFSGDNNKNEKSTSNSRQCYGRGRKAKDSKSKRRN